MRQGGIAAAFTQQVDPTGGRVDIAITRPGDQTGAMGTGLLAAVLFEPVAAGQTADHQSPASARSSGGGAAVAAVRPDGGDREVTRVGSGAVRNRTGASARWPRGGRAWPRRRLYVHRADRSSRRSC